MEIYNYQHVTGEFLGASEARPDPEEDGRHLVPANATATAPPTTTEEGMVWCWTGEEWVSVEDHRGEMVYYTANGQELVITDLGALPDGVTEDEPGEFQKWDDVAQSWIMDVEALAATKLALIQAAKVAARDAGFEVAGVLYDSDLSARVAYRELSDELADDETYTTSWKASEGVWVTMDAALYAQVYATGKAHVAAVFAWQAAREAEVYAAVDANDAEALAAVSTTYAPE